AVIGFSILAAALSLHPALAENMQDRIRSDLFTRLAIIAVATRKQTDLDRAHWDALADQLSAAGRVTFIDARGELLGDSQVPLAELPQVENHRERPEVASALAGTPALATRNSGTVHQRLLYAAIPLALPGGGRGAARLAVPLDEVDAAVRKVQ